MNPLQVCCGGLKPESMSVLSHALPGMSAFTGRHPFNTVLNYVTTEFGDFANLPTTSTWVHAGYGDPQHALRIQVHDFAGTQSPTLLFDFNVDVFDERQRSWAITQYLNLLDAFLADPQQRLGGCDADG